MGLAPTLPPELSGFTIPARRNLGWLAVVLVSPVVAWGVAGCGDKPLLTPSSWMVAWALMGSPIVEEVVYRQLVQAGLERSLAGLMGARAPQVAQAGAAVCFALVHAPIHGLAALAWLVPGGVLAELYRQTRRLWACVALHAWFNACLWWASRWLADGVGCTP